MSFYTPDNLAAQAGGRWVRPPSRPLDGVAIDSRRDVAGRVFIAVEGANHDGHDHAAAAVAAGAGAVIAHRRLRGLPADAGLLLVDDTRRALGRLAAAYRRVLAGTRVIAVTGSAGKTTVKALVHAVLSTSRRGTAAPRSFNNEIGVPLSILAADPGDDYLVLEIGANAPGEIDALGAVAGPDVAVITCVGRAHLAGFGSVAAVAREKAMLLRHLAPAGLAVVHAGSPLLRPHVDGDAVLFGETPDAHVRLAGYVPDGRGSRLELGDGRRLRLGLPGRHNAVNALAAVAVAGHLGIGDDAVARALARFRPVEMRLSRHDAGGVTVYNDAYNANPDAVIASLETFAELAAGAPRRVVVLGDMRELGPHAPALHREVGEHLETLDARVRLDRVVLVGEHARCTAEPIARRLPPDRITILPDLPPRHAAALAALLEPGDTVLIKGSRALALESLLEAIQARHP